MSEQAREGGKGGRGGGGERSRGGGGGAERERERGSKNLNQARLCDFLALTTWQVINFW